jgi:hypothetical protein
LVNYKDLYDNIWVDKVAYLSDIPTAFVSSVNGINGAPTIISADNTINITTETDRILLSSVKLSSLNSLNGDVTLSATDEVIITTDTPTNNITIGCTTGYKSGDLNVTGDIKINGNIIASIDDVFQGYLNIGNSALPLNFNHAIVRGSGVKNINVNVYSESGDVDNEKVAYLSDINTATSPINSAIETLNQKITTIEQLGAFAGSFATFGNVPINIIGYNKPVSINDFIHVIDDETHYNSTTQYVITSINSDTGMITYIFDLVVNSHTVSSVNLKTGEVVIGMSDIS